jgi:hypothetical protein
MTQNNSSRVFVAHFADGQRTRMTVHTSLARLDVGRGVRLAQHAYRSRTGQEPPPLESAHFESCEGQVLKSYSAGALAEIAS